MNEERPISMEEVCTTLQVAPHVVRSLLAEYRDCISFDAAEEGLSRKAFGQLAQIHAWRGQGLSPAEIRRRLAALEQAGEAEEAGFHAVLDQLGQVANLLKNSEEKRADDRDRLMVALMRTQQEIQQLRYEVAAAKSRRDRRQGFWARLFR